MTSNCPGSSTTNDPDSADDQTGATDDVDKLYPELDISYICNNIIAMSYPSTGEEVDQNPFRNTIEEVKSFLEAKHPDHYYVYNLCSVEMRYDVGVFNDRVAEKFGFEDQTPPRFEMIDKFCEELKSWLDQDKENVAVVHCKAGRGRTGTMISCFLLYQGLASTDTEAFERFAEKRGIDLDLSIIPSQRKWVRYYQEYLADGSKYEPEPILVKSILLNLMPFDGQRLRPLVLSLKMFDQDGKRLRCSPQVDRVRVGEGIRLDLKDPVIVQGDVRVAIHAGAKKILCFWINTAFFDLVGDLSQGNDGEQLCLGKLDLDHGFRDRKHKTLPSDFRVSLVFTRTELQDGAVTWIVESLLNTDENPDCGESSNQKE